MTVGDIIGEPYDIHPEVAPQGRPAPQGPGAARAWSASTPSTSTATRTSSPAASGSASASPAALALRPEDHHLRRAGLGARRLGPGAGHQPAGEAAGRVRPVLHLHRPRPVGRAAHLRPGRRHVPRQDRRDRRRGRRSTSARRTPTRRPCCPPCRCPTRPCAASASGSSSTGDVPSPANPPVRLPVPHPVLEGPGHLRRGGARADRAPRGPTTRAACHFAAVREDVVVQHEPRPGTAPPGPAVDHVHHPGGRFTRRVNRERSPRAGEVACPGAAQGGGHGRSTRGAGACCWCTPTPTTRPSPTA